VFLLPRCRNKHAFVSSLRPCDERHRPLVISPHSLRGLRLAAAGTLMLLGPAPVTPSPGEEQAWRMPVFWQRLAQCETAGRWDWGRLASTPHRRHLEGTRFEGGIGFAASTWRLWAEAVGVLDDYPHAWMAPPRVQVQVGAYGLRRGGSWGCLRHAYG
jgi:hypothetical protein